MTMQLDITTTDTTSAPCAAGTILLRVLDVLEREGVPCVLLHGYEQYPRRIPSDVDCLLPASAVPGRLATILHANREEIGADLVQWVDGGGARFIALAGRGQDGTWAVL